MKIIIEQLGKSLLEGGSDKLLRQWARRINDEQIPLNDLLPLLDYKKPVSMRFMWLVGGLCELNPAIVYPSVNYFYSKRSQVQIIGYDRSLAKMFLLAGIPPEIEGEVIDTLFKWLQDPANSVSTKSFSMLALYKLTSRYQDLKNELQIVIENQLGKNSTSFEKQAGKILGALQDI